VDTTARRTRDALARHTERRRLERARMITSAGVDQVALVAGQDYAPVLRRAFAARARRLHRG
jgi:transcriptional regulator GlxA family with amidase domain